MAKSTLKQIRNRSYLAKDFDGLKSTLLQYAQLYYPDKMQDFSDSSLGGMFLDLAAYTGDIMSFYLDHQYNELDPESAIEIDNIERLIRSAGVPIIGAAPATVEISFFIEVPAALSNGTYVPLPSALPTIKANSTFSSTNNVNFILLADVDFSKKLPDGTYAAEIKIGEQNANDAPRTFIMSMPGLCVSGNEISETFQIGSFTPFKTIRLSLNNVTDILTVTDNFGNVYYEVNNLSDDVVYKNVLNTAHDSNEITDALKVVPAPYRFISVVDLETRSTTLILGGGNDETLEDDVVPDPSDFAVSFPYSKTFSRTAINPLRLLNTRTLGVYSPNSQLTVTYRHGGGLSHNVAQNTISFINSATVQFPLNPSLDIMNSVKSSLAVQNRVAATGGEDSPSITDLKNLIPSMKNSQERIVTKEDLLARVYTIPSNFGRVYRAAVRSNPNNPLSTQLYIITRSAGNKLSYASDTLKENIRKYLEPYRLVTDAIDVLDAKIVNLKFTFDISVDPSLNQENILSKILQNLVQEFQITNFSIDQPIVLSDIENLIYATPGVISIIDKKFENLSGNVDNRNYSNISFNVKESTRKGILYPPEGGIFEFKFLDFDIIGRAT